MSSFNHFKDAYNEYRNSNQKISDPGSGGTFNLRGIDKGYAEIASGTRKLPDSTPKGVDFRVYATGSVTLTTVGGTTVATLASGEYADCTPLTSTTWGATMGTAGALEINSAADVPFPNAATLTAANNVSDALGMALQNVVRVNSALTTVGTGTITAAQLVGGLITRSGSTAAYTDTTHTAAQIIAVLDNSQASASTLTGYAWEVTIRNTVAFAQTIAGGSGVTVNGVSVIPPNSAVTFKVIVVEPSSGSEDIQMYGLGISRQCDLPNAQFNTTAAASGLVPAAGILTGANHVYFAVTTSGAFSMTTRTAAELFGDIPNCHIGFKYLLTIISDGDNTVTVLAGSNVTIPGVPDTAATNTTKTFLVTFTTASAAVLQVVDMGAMDATA